MTFPQGITTIKVTGLDLQRLDGTPLNGYVIFTASEPVADPAVSAILEGPAVSQVTNGVMVPLTLPTTDCVSPSFTYTIELRVQTGAHDQAPATGVSIPHTLGSAVDLSSLLP